MKNARLLRFGVSGFLAGLIFLLGCSSLPVGLPVPASTRQTSELEQNSGWPHVQRERRATVAYMWGNNQAMENTGGLPQTILAYSTISSESSLPVATLTLPPLYEGVPLAVDSSGQLYVGGLNGSVLVYPPNSAGAATPSRTINVNSADEVIALAVDPTGLLYVGTVGTDGYVVTVYPADANGAAAPLRTVQLPYSDSVLFLDLAEDAVGNIYAAFLPDFPTAGTLGYIDVFSPETADPTPTRTIRFPSPASVCGVAVDRDGHIFADACPTFGRCTIEEFAANADGAASPIKTINVPNQIAGVEYWGGPVRLDRAGNIFVSYSVAPGGNLFIYGLAPNAHGNAAPIVQIGSWGTYSTHFAIN